VALASAPAASLLSDQQIISIEISFEANINNNGMAAIIQGSNGLSGLENAAALSVFGGYTKLELGFSEC